MLTILSIIAVRYTESVLYFFSVLSTLLFLLVRFVQYVIDRFPRLFRGISGEYRIRTDDPLLAKQVL